MTVRGRFLRCVLDAVREKTRFDLCRDIFRRCMVTPSTVARNQATSFLSIVMTCLITSSPWFPGIIWRTTRTASRILITPVILIETIGLIWLPFFYYLTPLLGCQSCQLHQVTLLAGPPSRVNFRLPPPGCRYLID